MEKVVELTEKELAMLIQNKARIDELHVGGKSTSIFPHNTGTPLRLSTYLAYFPKKAIQEQHSDPIYILTTF